MSPITTPLTQEQLQRLASGSEPVAEHVIDLFSVLQEGDEESRAWASDALQTLEVLPLALAEQVAEKCHSPQAAVAAWGCKLLTKLGNASTAYQSAIVSCLNDHPVLSTRQQAALSLASIPALDSAAKDALRRAAESDDPRLKRLATSALASAEA
ncbi:MAG: hypothetical protein ABI557_09025 [Aureliella sp.]